MIIIFNAKVFRFFAFTLIIISQYQLLVLRIAQIENMCQPKDNNNEIEADNLKNQGNEYFKNKDYKNAAKLYTQAIQLFEKSIYYTNRANCLFQLEDLIQAEKDAQRAIELDPQNYKGYWRLAEISLVKQDNAQALKFYKKAKEIKPNSQLINSQIDKLSNKQQKPLFFDLQKALSGIQIRSMSETSGAQQFQYPQKQQYQQRITIMPEQNRTFLIPDNIETKSFKEKAEFFNTLKDYIFNKNNLLSTQQFGQLLLLVNKIFKQQKSIQTLQFKHQSKYFICGDLHGSAPDTKKVLEILEKQFNFEDPKDNHFIILGDMVDRGSFSTQILTLIYTLQVLYPNNVHIIRGNHEAESLNQFFGFRDEFDQKYGYNTQLYKSVLEIFRETSICLLIDELDENNQVQETTMCVHGGCPIVNNIKSGEEFRQLNFDKEDEYENELAKQMLWNDPSNDEPNIRPSYRGVGYIYGKQMFEEFKQKIGIKRVFRGHEVVYDQIGVRDDFGDKTHITIFSSSNYQGCINGGGIVVRTIVNSLQIFQSKNLNKFFDAIIQNNIDEVYVAKSKYFQCYDSRQQVNKKFQPKNEIKDIKNAIITGFPASFYAIMYQRNEILEIILNQSNPALHLQKSVTFNYKVFQSSNDDQRLSINPQTNVLSFAVAVNNVFAVKKILEKFPQLSNEVNSIGCSLLQVAVSVNNEASQEILFNKNIIQTQLAAVDERYRNPMYFASLYGRIHIIKKWSEICLQNEDLKRVFIHSILQLSDNYIKIYKIAEIALEDYQSKGTTPELKYETAQFLREIYEKCFQEASELARKDRIMSQLISLQLQQERFDVNKSNLIQSKVSMCIEDENGEEVDIEKKEDCIISSGILE